MKRKILFLTLMILGFASTAQKFSVKGVVTDATGPMASSTVMILNPKDSSLVNFGVTNSIGAFEIKNINPGQYQLKVSFVGYAPFIKNFLSPENGNTLDLGQLVLQPKSEDLNDVVVKGERNPVTVKRDTIEFNASSFKTKANANVEDLLKKMPGIEVDTDGTINAQGEQVQQVTVDGREFFGRDPKLATRNLPADAIDKVQVFDKKSDQATFTGIDDGQKTKTINLELKEEKRNAAFGNLMAGYGTNDRFQAKANVNRFNKTKQFSFLGMGNNINEQGFSFTDAMNFNNGGSGIGGGGGVVSVQIGGGGGNSGVPINFGGRQNGIMTNYAGGVNFNNDFNKKKTQIGGNYFYSYLQQNLITDLNRINYLPDDSSYNFNQNSTQLSTSESHRANLNIDHKIDSANSIKFTSSLSYSNSDQNTKSYSETSLEDGTKVNDSDRTIHNESISTGINNNLLWRHRFAKKGRSLSTNLTFNVSQTDSKGNQDTQNNYQYDVPKYIVQTNTQSTDNLIYGATAAYTEPLGNRKYLEINYNYRANLNDVNRLVFDDNSGNPVKNTQLSNEYNSNYTYNKPGINFRVNRQKFNFTVGTSYQSTRLKGDLISKGATIDRTFQNWIPTAVFNYDFTSFKHLRLDYQTDMNEPSIQQLQPIVDNSDPLNISVGNPDLKPSYQQSINLRYNMFDPAKFFSFFLRGSLNYTTNAIVNSQSVDSRLIRTTKPVNVKDVLAMNGNLNIGFPIKKLFSRLNFGTSITENQSITILNDVESNIQSETLGGNVRYNFTFKEFFTLDLSANIRNQNTSYESNSANNQKFTNSTYTAETNITILKHWQLNGDFNYYQYDSKTNDFSQSIPIMNVWLSRFILKANAGEIKLGVSNVLNKSLSVTQNASVNYLQQQTTNNLGRYIMLSFTYALNRQLNPFGGGRRGPGGGMRMIINN